MAEGFVPPQEVRSNAKRGLELRKKHGRGGTEVGVARARDLSNGSALSLDTIKRMNSYFARHEVDKKGEGWGKDSAGYIAWLLWGGDSGWAWAKKIIREQENKEKTTMSNLTTSYFGIEKADRHADGTMTVYGKATDDSLDIDKQICDGDWLDRAMPNWFKSGGNIREQHSNIAAGVAKNYELKADGHYITALVVDPVSVKKVENGVLRGFSIGIKNPRVIQDSKAANGRIVDGQIVEVSLVDRPANPNCQLVLAKSVSGDENIMQVEELIENEELVVDNVLQSSNTLEEESSPMENTDVVKSAKTILGDLIKFDKTQYEAAREALANLISVEAQEMKEGHNEIMSISHLLEAVAHLHAWYEGEEAEGEVMEEETIIENKAASDKEDLMPRKGEDRQAFMKRCMKAGETEEAFDKRCKMYKEAMDKEANSNPVPTEETGANLDTATIVPPAATPKSAEVDGLEVADIVADEAPEAVEEVPAEEEKVSEVPSSEEVEAIVEQAIKSATASIKTEIAELLSAKKAVEEKAVSLENELAIAKSLAVAGGPKRTGTSIGQSNDLLVKAATYKAKAQATTDPVLAKGFNELAKEFYAKAANPEAHLTK